jgi:hypothetical protein
MVVIGGGGCGEWVVVGGGHAVVVRGDLVVVGGGKAVVVRFRYCFCLCGGDTWWWVEWRG